MLCILETILSHNWKKVIVMEMEQNYRFSYTHGKWA